MRHIGFQLQANKTISMHGGFVLPSQKAPLLGLSMACVEMHKENPIQELLDIIMVENCTINIECIENIATAVLFPLIDEYLN